MVPSAVLFDMDGVLIRSEEAWLRVLEDAGRRFRGSPVTREEFAPTFGQGTAEDVRVFGLRCTPAELDAFYVEHLPAHAGDVWVNPDARGLLESLAARGLRRAVVTNTVSTLARTLLGAARLLDFFEVLACSDLVAQAKPAPDLVLYALGRLGLPPEAAVMVGDSRFDRGAARAAGVRFVGLGLDGDARIERLGELLPLLPLTRGPASPGAR
ncbi:phosphoglycolate phosphatase/AHBA synthesis associated protein [Archangium gephyra]|uniref:phosphoglycolate phosphatase n=1 Tax=Archangium gephyra TaxID=48 RepID=A0AAC8TJI5_9BACT|nr:HAD-IA family hydrolase [Archangium gephyra]AKJ07950.1 putative hydrolase [Archangium gephyra]REG29696.1 phosphoglycolate phosphatase/AHBA synthesis associated protein [Archangium gephyra]